MADEKSGVDQALDVLVYAPLGFLFTVKDELPGLIAKGRARLDANFTTARFVGQYAVKQARKDVDAAVGRMAERVARPTPPAAATVAGPVAVASPIEPPPVAHHSANGSSGVAPPVATLAIPGYDSLSASQVVQRLAGLSPAELDAVSAYEEAHRGRRTILSKIAQLQAERR